MCDHRRVRDNEGGSDLRDLLVASRIEMVPESAARGASRMRSGVRLVAGGFAVLMVVGVASLTLAWWAVRVIASGPEPLPDAVTGPLLPAETRVTKAFASEYSPTDGEKTYLFVEDLAPQSGDFVERWRDNLESRGFDTSDAAAAYRDDLIVEWHDYAASCPAGEGTWCELWKAQGADDHVVVVQDRDELRAP